MKRMIALWGIMLMFFSILPAGTVKADAVEDVAQAKACIDAILDAAPTPEEYVFTEELAEEVDQLGRLLQGMTQTSDMESLDDYVTEKTTVDVVEVTPPEEGSGDDPVTTYVKVTRYRSVQKFYQDYADAQNRVLAKLAKPIEDAVEEVLSKELVRTGYDQARALYDAASKHIRAAVDADHVNSLNQLRELLELADAADRTISNIAKLNSESSRTDYTFFLEDVDTAKTAYGLYDSKFTELRRFGKYADCLTRTMKNTVLVHYADYEKALLIYDVEKAYDDLGVYDSLSDSVRERLDTLQEAVDAGTESDFQISVYDYYRGEAIHYVLSQYTNVVTFEQMMAMVPEMPANKTELTAALRAYRFYNGDLTEEERDLVPASYVEKMNQAVLLNTNCEEVMEAIDDIGAAVSEEEYEAYAARYDLAYRAYRRFVNTYGGICDIPDLITNIAVFDTATDVLEMIQSIRQMEETEDAMMCSKKLQIESLIRTYDGMPKAQRDAVYNIESLQSINRDVQSASSLRMRLDVLRNSNGGYSLLDEALVKTLRSDYENLNARAKRYFGENYLSQLAAVEKELEAQGLNAALRVTTLINQIGTVDARARDRIANARNAYDALSSVRKSYVPNLATLVAAEQAYAKLDISLTKATIPSLGSYRFTGAAVKPVLSVKLNGVALTQNVDYRVTYTSNINAGKAKVTLQGIGFYTGSVTKTFTIQAVSLSGATVRNLKAKYAYTGKKVKPAVQVVLSGNVLRKTRDYKVSYQNNKKRGVATLTIKGTGNCTGSIKKTFKIVKGSVKKAKVSGLKTSYKRTGRAICPKVKVKLNSVTLKKNRDYRLSYQKNKKKGTAAVVIKGIGNYTGSLKKTFKIV